MDGSMEDLAGTRINRRFTDTPKVPRPFKSRIFTLVSDLHFAGIEFCALLSSSQNFPNPEHLKSRKSRLEESCWEQTFTHRRNSLLLTHRTLWQHSYGFLIGTFLEMRMGERADVWQGTLALMVLKTIEMMGPQHGYGIARRIEQTSGNLLTLNYGTLYPALLKLEQEGSIASEWGVSENNRKAKFYKLTRAGRKQLEKEARNWQQTTAILDRFLAPIEEQS
jgi:PadR family transcriptional regulator PadR